MGACGKNEGQFCSHPNKKNALRGARFLFQRAVVYFLDQRIKTPQLSVSFRYSPGALSIG